MAKAGTWHPEGNPEEVPRSVPPFVGRRDQLNWFSHQLQGVKHGAHCLVLLQAEAGMGKTRLLHEVRGEAISQGLQVFMGRCYEDLALSYLSLIEALLAQWEQLPETLQRPLAAEMAMIRQFLYPATLEATALHPLQADQEKLKLFRAVSRAAMQLAQQSPIVIIVDDLHWADQPTLELFGYLAFAIAETAMQESLPLLIFGAYRPAAADSRLARLTDRLQRETMCQTLTLSGLGEADLYDLLPHLGVARPAHQLVQTLGEVTQGNPLFIQEVLYQLAQQGALQERGGYMMTSSSAADIRLPDHVADAIRSRFNTLSESCRNVLVLASFLGERFDYRTLSAISEQPEEDLLAALEEGLHQHLLLSEGQMFQFAHPLIRHSFYNEPSTVRRQRLHGQIAQVLEHLQAGNPDNHRLDIARHIVRAGPFMPSETALVYARQAGAQALAYFAWAEAIQFYEAALAASGPSGMLSAYERAELHYWAGLAYYRHQDVAPCLEHFTKAIAAYRETDDVPGLARALMALVRTQYTLASVPLGTLIDLQPLQDVLESLEASEAELRGYIFAVMAEAYRTARQTDQARDMAGQALAIGKQLSDEPLCAYAAFVMALAETMDMRVQDALRAWDQAIAHARPLPDEIVYGWSLQRMPLLLIVQGRLDEAEAMATEACALTRTTHDWGGYSVALSTLAVIALAKGQFEPVERHTRDAMAMVERSRYPWGGLRALYALACSHALRGNWTQAQAALDNLVRPGTIFQEPGEVIGVFVETLRQYIAALAGDGVTSDTAWAVELQRIGLADAYALGPFSALADIADMVASEALATSAYTALQPVAGQGVLFTGSWVASIPRALGVSQMARGEWDAAEQHLQHAIDVTSRAGAQPELGRAYLSYARLLMQRDRATDRYRALVMGDQAGAIFEVLGMVPFARQAEQLGHQLRGALPAGSSAYNLTPTRAAATEAERGVLLRLALNHVNFLG